MIDEIQRIEFWGTHNPDTNKKKQNMVALINKVYYTNNDTILCIDGWINYNGEIFETTKPLLKINLTESEPIWYLCVGNSCEQIVSDENFKKLVLEGIETYISSKKNMLDRIKKSK